MKLKVLLISIVLFAPLTPSISATPPKAGATCAKSGLIQDYNGKKFTCVKSGKKLVWNDGVVIKQALPLPQPTPTSKPTPTVSESPTQKESSAQSISPSPTSNQEKTSDTGKSPEFIDISLKSSGESTADFVFKATDYRSYKVFLVLVGDASGKELQSTSIINAYADSITLKFSNLECGRDDYYEGRVTLFSGSNGTGYQRTGGAKLSSATPCGLSGTPKEGAGCPKIGDRVTNDSTYFECRWVAGKKLVWFSLSKTPVAFINPASPQSVDVCKLKGEIENNAVLGFGPDLSKRYVPPIGKNRSLIVPIDFPDIPGDEDLISKLEYQKQQLLDWVKYFSAGKLDLQVDYINRWLRAPLPSKEYDINYDPNFATLDKRTTEGDELTRKYAQKYIDFITNQVDLTKYQTVYIFYPSAQKEMRDFVPRVKPYKVKEGEAILSVFARGSYDAKMETPYWSFWLHETGHDWGLKGHAPGDGWPVGIMQTQAGLSLSLSGWDQFLLTWLPDSQVYCETKDTLKTAEIKLSPLEREDKQTKIVTIKLDSSRLLVIESHGIEKWTSRRPSTQFYDFEQYGYYSVMSYIVSTNSTGGLVRDRLGASIASDNGNNDSVPRQAQFYPIVGDASNRYGLNKFNSEGTETNNSYFAVQGDSFLIEGIRIKFVKSGDYNTIQISKE